MIKWYKNQDYTFAAIHLTDIDIHIYRFDNERGVHCPEPVVFGLPSDARPMDSIEVYYIHDYQEWYIEQLSKGELKTEFPKPKWKLMVSFNPKRFYMEDDLGMDWD